MTPATNAAWWTPERRREHGRHVSEITACRDWDDDTIREALHAIAERYGRCTSNAVLQARREGMPVATVVAHEVRYHGGTGWASALRRMGLPSSDRGGRYEWSLSDDALVDAARRCAQTLGHAPSITEYDAWRAPRKNTEPSSVYLCKRLGGWGGVLSRLESK